MSELKSKCCGANVIEYHYSYIKGNRGLKEYECEKCKKKPTEVKDKDKPQDTALHASLRR